MVKKKANVQETAAMAEPIAVETTSHANDLRAKLDEIKTYEGVIGYILRNTTSATIDLKDPSKIIDYAVLSSSGFDSSQALSELFDLGDIKNLVVEGGEIKMLSLSVEENKISVFMEKNADCDKVLKKLHAL